MMKRYIKSSLANEKKRQRWNSNQFAVADDDEFQKLADEFNFGEIEQSVADEYDIYLEPSIQGNRGGMFLFDTNQEYDPIEIDWQRWLDMERELASNSKSAKEFKQKFANHFEGLL